ncbi:unnamed protein product [Prunus armeniaca]|uniref:Transmembrane protein n=1 Tax=Prunus armeniaca TaxID=36596 RepID=A0A6J5WZC5_PRUAR|nr:unnamed protein product [Prunus armeniaca]
MDLAPEELQFLTIPDILRESTSIPKQSPKTFYLITLTLIFPLSFAILAHSLFTHPLLNQLQGPSTDPAQLHHKWTVLLLFQFCYLIFLFAFSLLSTAAVVFTVASLYTSKPVSFSSTLSAIPKVFKRLFITFLWVSLLMVCYNFVFVAFLILLILAIDTQNPLLLLFSGVVLFLLFLVVHVYITVVWHLASVVSVLEPVYGFAAMKKSYELLKGKIGMAFCWCSGTCPFVGLSEAFLGRWWSMAGKIMGVCFTMFARVTIIRGLTRVLCMITLADILENTCLSKAVFRWKTWMSEEGRRYLDLCVSFCVLAVKKKEKKKKIKTLGKACGI